MIIRPATSDDLAAITKCVDEAYSVYVPRIGTKPKPMLVDYEAQVRAGLVHVAVDRQGTVLGYIIFHARTEATLLENVAVSPRHQGKGVGKRLIAFCESEARRRGHHAVELYTHEKMSENRRLYEKLGYVEIAREPDDGLERVFFRKYLS